MKTNQTICICRIRSASLFKIFFIGYAGWITPLFLFGGLCAFLGVDVIKSDEEYIHGFQALGSSILLSVIFPVILAFFSTLFTWPGLWIYSRFRSTAIEYVTPKKAEPCH